MQNDLISKSERYMNDLIRRKDVLELFPTNDCSDKMIGLYERVLDIQTAYDVEKVCEQLGEKSFDVTIEDDHIVPESNTRETFDISVIGIESAIEIVCNGGKE